MMVYFIDSRPVRIISPHSRNLDPSPESPYEYVHNGIGTVTVLKLFDKLSSCYYLCRVRCCR